MASSPKCRASARLEASADERTKPASRSSPRSGRIKSLILRLHLHRLGVVFRGKDAAECGGKALEALRSDSPLAAPVVERACEHADQVGGGAPPVGAAAQRGVAAKPPRKPLRCRGSQAAAPPAARHGASPPPPPSPRSRDRG
eukprot:scaffold24546_cov35-Tisochrysis_lutea.AAC.5